MKTIITFLLLQAGLRLCCSQGFVNLSLQQADVVPIGPDAIAVTNALPGWSVFYGGIQQSFVTFNDPALGATFVTLLATNGQQLSGNYSVLLQGGGTASAATISQTGHVPASAESLLFDAAATRPDTSVLIVSLGGEDLSFIAISNGPNYSVYGADVSAFAGQTEALTFSAPEDLSVPNIWNINDISFSSAPIPEPSPLGLLAVGGFLLTWFRATTVLRRTARVTIHVFSTASWPRTRSLAAPSSASL